MKKYLKPISISLCSALLLSTVTALSIPTNRNANQFNTHVLDNTQPLMADNIQVVNSLNDVQFVSSSYSSAMFAVVKGTSPSGGDQLYAWGANNYGQLGINSSSASINLPTIVVGFQPTDKITHIATSMEYSVVILNNNQLWATGINRRGQFGNGNKDTGTVRSFQKTFTFPTGTVTSLSAGDRFAAAVVDHTDIYTWGDSNSGQLGNGSYNEQLVPTRISESIGGTIGDIKCGSAFCIVQTTTNNVDSFYLWGDNGSYQLGDGIKSFESTKPKLLNFSFQGKILDFYVGNDAVMVSTVDSTTYRLYAWGFNNEGQLGVQTASDPYALTIPTLIPNLPNEAITSISMTGSGTVLSTASKAVYATGTWWRNGLGGSTGTTKFTKLTDVSATKVAGSSNVVFAIDNGVIKAWGDKEWMFGGGKAVWESAVYTPVIADPFGLVSSFNQSAAVANISALEALNDFYPAKVFDETKFKQYIDLTRFPVGAKFTLTGDPVAVPLAGTLQFTVSVDKHFADPTGVKTLAAKTFTDVIISGFKVVKDSEVVNQAPTEAEFDNIVSTLKKGEIVSNEVMNKLIDTSLFPPDTTFEITSEPVADKTQGKLMFEFIPSKVYKDGVSIPNAGVHQVNLQFTQGPTPTPTPGVDTPDNTGLIIGLSIGGVVLVLIAIGLMIIFYKRYKSNQ